ncbi:cysteine synthase B [Halomonas elongata]|uniref:cysteine synthase n=1 Tax=Halomonas elongata TaxID=2746 RepID=A0A1B8P0N2_HALEL|nr:cysteine synthase B [Halomonas elongata]
MQFPTLEDTIGHTPLVRLKRITAGHNNTLLAKLEGNNPAGSVKDRPALSMLDQAEKRGTIAPGTPSSRPRPAIPASRWRWPPPSRAIGWC